MNKTPESEEGPAEEEDSPETEDSEEEKRSGHRHRNPKSSNRGDELARLAGSQYDEGIDDQVDFERERTKSLEQRGIQVITTSGVLTTLLFGLAKFGPGITLGSMNSLPSSPP